ncbi:MAG: HAMP domain-containing histidine kinase [Cyclobacteriaceae bacterium]|nr:HAMP domain-containing histidine kinase [Cyclobacteriaceae bacterium]
MKLLNRTIKSYLLYSALLLLLCTPLFYFAIQQLFIWEMDKVLRSHKTDFYEAHANLKTEEDLKFFQLMNKEFILIPSNGVTKKDSLFTIDLYDSSKAEVILHRVFCTGVVIQGQHYELQVRESLVSSISLIGAIMGIQTLMLTGLLTGLVLINRRLSNKIWGPFYVILDHLKKFKIDEGNQLLLPRPSTAEFRDLTTVITQLVDKNRSAYANQKEFTENASHELQTPLAICRTKLELLAQTKELTQEQADLVGHLLNAMDRITHLNKNLLLLSKIENRQFFDTEEISLKNVVQKSIEVYKRQVLEKEIKVESTMHESVRIMANPILIEVLIGNLISNAIRHTTQSGSVVIEVTKTFIMISNSGLPLDRPEKLFQRFHRESRTTLGSGLGLSIVKKVCDVSGFSINYNFNLYMHHFRVTFR